MLPPSVCEVDFKAHLGPLHVKVQSQNCDIEKENMPECSFHFTQLQYVCLISDTQSSEGIRRCCPNFTNTLALLTSMLFSEIALSELLEHSEIPTSSSSSSIASKDLDILILRCCRHRTEAQIWTCYSQARAKKRAPRKATLQFCRAFIQPIWQPLLVYYIVVVVKWCDYFLGQVFIEVAACKCLGHFLEELEGSCSSIGHDLVNTFFFLFRTYVFSVSKKYKSLMNLKDMINQRIC